MMNRSTVLSLTAIFLGTVAASPLLLPTTAEAGGRISNVNTNTMKIDGVRYWRKNAREAELGAVGVKMTPAVGSNFFKHKQSPPKGIFKVHTEPPVTIAKNKTSGWGVTVGRSNIGGSAGGNGQSAANYTLYKMRIHLGDRNGDLRHETNRAIKHLNALKNEGKKGRLISAVWVLVEGSESKASCYTGDLTVSAGGWNIETNAAGCVDSSYRVEPGSIVAYEMVKVDDWDNAERSEKPTCPRAYPKYEARSSVAHPKDRCAKETIKDRGVRCKLKATDKRSNWYVKEKSGRDTCKSRKGKPNKTVECVHGSDKYVAQAGKDKCQETTVTYKDPTCPAGYDYNKRTGNGGVDRCELRGIADLKVDGNSGF